MGEIHEFQTFQKYDPIYFGNRLEIYNLLIVQSIIEMKHEQWVILEGKLSLRRDESHLY